MEDDQERRFQNAPQACPFSNASVSKLLVLCGAPLGTFMSNPAIRCYHMAKELALEFDVVLMSPERADADLEGVEVVTAPAERNRLEAAIEGFDVVVAQKLPLATMRRLARTQQRVIYDLHVPFLSESLGYFGSGGGSYAEQMLWESAALGQRFALATGNAFICASERQRDLWIGVLAGLGRIDLDLYQRDRNLRDLIDVVPVGLDPEPPSNSGPVLKGVQPGIGEESRVLLWTGGIWHWFDPFTVIRAVARVAERRDDVRLVFLGVEDLADPTMATARRAVDLARSLGLLDRIVFFRQGWVPYGERHGFLLEADIAVTAHFDTLETRYAFRTRMLDHFWAGLPTLATRGDVLADLVASRGLGRALDVEDVDGWVDAIEQLLTDERERDEIRRRLERVREELAWPRVVAPLTRLAKVPGSPVSVPRAATAMAAEDLRLRFRASLALGGPRALLRRQGAKLFQRTGLSD